MALFFRANGYFIEGKILPKFFLPKQSFIYLNYLQNESFTGGWGVNLFDVLNNSNRKLQNIHVF